MRTSRFAIAAAIALSALSVAFAAPGEAIVGGTAAPNGAYPFIASVQRDGSHFCGGSVIAPTWVLTAAHCVPDGDASDLTVRVGSNDNTSGGTVIPVTEVRVHPNYDTNWDAALLHLGSTVPANVTPITLAGPANDNLEAAGAPVRVIGWGDFNPLTMGLLAGPTLNQVDLTVVGDADCSGSTTSDEALTNVCAQGFLKDSCQGDSGGPLFATVGSQRIQVGIVSRGFLCAIPSFPGYYSEVNSPSIRSFITQYAGV